ncbi:threonine synthase-like 1 [Gadus macrocephalus]|uniref:threonine synthase-like 1 n=1 Tax=Gadus macrocephalus TaxID=80720 RepID=UPI0028CB935B|nr:threonine synthase-like 1 [Gadus macrocephalus]
MRWLNASRAALGAVRRYNPGPSSAATVSWLSTKSCWLGDKNILLMGPPGAGKTSVGRIVAQRLGLPAIDVDDDVLEKAWRMPVATKLAAVGGECFLEEEGQALCGFSAAGSVVSLSGSNPLHAAAMQHVARSGVVVYLDVAAEDILQRLSLMKVNRVVGQEAGVSMRDILGYRKQFYERWLDIRVLCGVGDTVEQVAEKVVTAVERYHHPDAETYVSTRGDSESPARSRTHFSDVVIEGLAPDGGLYVPRGGFPKIDAREWLRLADMSYAELASAILEKCVHPSDVPAVDLRAMTARAYGDNFSSPAVAPVRHLEGNQYVQELFHGPTASFKDLALQLMPQLFSHCLPPDCNFLVLVATSGDTGSAVLSGFGGLGGGGGEARGRTGVLVFYPQDGVSDVQKLQMASYREGNARAVSVRADFDFCQRSIKRMFGEGGLAGHLAVEYGTVLSTANSINWARLLPQVVYHASAYLSLFREGVVRFGEPVDFCVPSGNFGNAMSALYAKRMGLPVGKVICASNRNRVIADFINTGEFDLRGRPLAATASPAIDILKPSNVERFLWHASGGDGRLVAELYGRLEREQRFVVAPSLLAAVQEEVQAGWCGERECAAVIRDVHRRTGYLMDPHTAVAKAVADRLQGGGAPVVICSTAHYGKFGPAVLGALQVEPAPKDPLEQLQRLGSLARCGPGVHRQVVRCVEGGSGQRPRVCPAEYGALVEQVEDMVEACFLRVM